MSAKFEVKLKLVIQANNSEEAEAIVNSHMSQWFNHTIDHNRSRDAQVGDLIYFESAVAVPAKGVKVHA